MTSAFCTLERGPAHSARAFVIPTLLPVPGSLQLNAHQLCRFQSCSATTACGFQYTERNVTMERGHWPQVPCIKGKVLTWKLLSNSVLARLKKLGKSRRTGIRLLHKCLLSPWSSLKKPNDTEMSRCRAGQSYDGCSLRKDLSLRQKTGKWIPKLKQNACSLILFLILF